MDVNKCFIFLLFAVIATSQAQKKCCFPAQYEALDGQVVGTVESGGGVALLESIKLAYDATNQRIGLHAVIQSQARLTTFQIIYDYKKGAEYIIDANSKTCQKLSLQGMNMSQCIPAEALYTSSFYVGDQKMMADTFNFDLKQGPLVGTTILSVSKGDCIPFSTTFIGTQGGTPVLSVAGFVNYTSGIEDPSSYFTVPEFCPKSYDQKPKMYHLQLLHGIFP